MSTRRCSPAHWSTGSAGARSDHRRRRVGSLAAYAVLGALLVALPVRAMHPNHPLSFSPEKAYQTGDIDHVDLFSGSLLVTIPIGPFTLSYSSNVWTYEYRVDPATGQVYLQSNPDLERSAGLGWHLGVGEIYSPTHAYNGSGKWMLVDHMGARHMFYGQLHKGEDDGDPNVHYSRDGSYLRLTRVSGCKVLVESPDGTTRSYTSGSCGGGTTLRLKKVWSPFATEANPDLTLSYTNNNLDLSVTDRYGRTHHIEYTNTFHWIKRVVTRVDLESFGGARAVYEFLHDDVLVSRSCKDDDDETPLRMRVPHLKQIKLPDGTSYRMKDAGGLLYYNTCAGNIDDVPGFLRGLILPTGGRLEWDAQEYEFPPGDNNSPFNTAAGVKFRRRVEAGGSVVGTWRYKSSSHWPPGEDVDPEMHTQVVYPTGDCSKHFFNARYWLTPSQGKGWERGLPFVYSEESGGKYLSSQIWTSNSGAGSCAGQKLRSTYLKFRKDQLPGSNDPQRWLHLNRQAKESRIVHHDDGGRWADSVSSDFDGLGHFRRETTTGNLLATPTNERRVTYTNFNRVTGTYPSGGYQPPAVSEPWVLGVFDYRTVSEPDAVGETQSRMEFGFEDATGFLSCRRTLVSAGARSGNDLLVTFARDAQGNVVDEKRYGGDLQVLPGFGTGGSQCGPLPSQPEYWVRHTYQNGVRTTSRPYQPSGTPGPFPTHDVDIDPGTGLVIASRDPSGLTTSYGRDEVGRVTSIAPPAGAVTEVQYHDATPTSPARVSTRRVDGAQVLTESEVILDDFARPWKERVKMPGGTWSERETRYNARDWVVSVSEMGDLSKKTSYLAFDPFGRAGIVRPPEGAAHDLRYTFLGARRVTREAKVALAGGESYVAVHLESDRHGRLRRVLEGSGDAGALTPTTYAYDVGGRLTGVTTSSVDTKGGETIQSRAFGYDNRGFLLSETHPEKGATGNGAVLYFDRDSSGHAHRVLDGPNDLARAYDFMGRLLTVHDLGNATRLVTKFEYDGAAGAGLGRLWRTTRYNWIDLPWNAAGEEDVRVREIRVYTGPGGALSQLTTRVIFAGQPQQIFTRSYAYDSLGALSRLVYPSCQHAACTATVGPGRQVDYVYDQGRLTQVPGWTQQISYHPGGGPTALPHVNGVTDHRLPDPDAVSRPLRLHTTGASEDWDSGTFVYDGAGNVKELARPFASDTFAYDQANRLAATTFRGWLQDFRYDSFGNLTRIVTTPPQGPATLLDIPVDAETNRLTTAGYDGAGNVTDWNGDHFEYDRSNRIRSLNGNWLYLYSAAGERVASIAWTGSLATRRIDYTLRDPGNRVLSQFELVGPDAAGNWSRRRDYIYGGGRLLASEGGGEVRHYHLDHLGSTRMITDAAGVTAGQHHFLPYGEEVTPAGDEVMKFTGHERDHATGLDYMHARYFTPALGRFLSVDSAPARPDFPQSWNRYAYTLGNPIVFVDPDGLQALRSDVRSEARGRIRQLGADAWKLANASLTPRERVFRRAFAAGMIAGTYFEAGLSELGIGFFNQNPYSLSLSDAIAFQLREEHRKTYELQTTPPPRATGNAATDAPAGEEGADCTQVDCFFDSIDVIDEPADDGGGGSGDDSKGYLLDGEQISGDTPISGTGLICGSGNNCIQISISGTAEEVAAELERIQAELLALESLNDLLAGGCMIHPSACALGGGGGGGGDPGWTSFYWY